MDTERTIGFILENQAKFSAQMGEIQAGMGELQTLVATIARQQSGLVQIVDDFQHGVSEAVLAMAVGQKELAEEHKRLAEAQSGLAEEQKRLAEAQRLGSRPAALGARRRSPRGGRRPRRGPRDRKSVV